MKIPGLPDDLLACYTTRGSIMNWIFGDRNGHMIGIPGGTCCLSICLAAFNGFIPLLIPG